MPSPIRATIRVYLQVPFALPPDKESVRQYNEMQMRSLAEDEKRPSPTDRNLRKPIDGTE